MSTLEEMVDEYLPFADKLANKRKKNLPRHIELEELQSAAYLGLVKAAKAYQSKFETSFTTYAYFRIMGEMNDYLRSLKKSPVSLDQIAEDGRCLKDTISAKDDRDFSELLEFATSNLDQQAETILKCYFAEDYSLKETGQQLGVTESRVSQLLSSYKKKIRDTIGRESFVEALAA